MADRYGIVVVLKAKEGKIDELIELGKGHFVRQHDGREPGATCASIIMPLPDEPNTVRFFEQVWKFWQCSFPHFCVFVEIPCWSFCPTAHGAFHKIEAVALVQTFKSIPWRLTTRYREQWKLTNCYFSFHDIVLRAVPEKWIDKESYELHSAPNENLAVFLEAAGPILDGAPIVLSSPMLHYEKK